MDNERYKKTEKVSDFKITKKRKEIWKTELELLAELIRVCDKYNLKYFLIGGSLIGAIRHKGFIPWDDDIDVGLLREDYNKLLKVADKEFKTPFFFQTPYNDMIYRGHAQIRNINTTAILKDELDYYTYNQGIFIDVFPFDEYPKTEKLKQRQQKKCKFLVRLMLNYIKGINNKKNWQNLLINPFVKIIGYKRIYKYYENVCSKYNGRGSGIVKNLSLRYENEKNKIKIEELQEFIDNYPFENLKIKIPKEYDKILKRSFGDYMVEKRENSYHGQVYFCTDIPYDEFIEKYKNNKEELKRFLYI